MYDSIGTFKITMVMMVKVKIKRILKGWYDIDNIDNNRYIDRDKHDDAQKY